MARELIQLTGLIVCIYALFAIVLGQTVVASICAVVGILLVVSGRLLP